MLPRKLRLPRSQKFTNPIFFKEQEFTIKVQKNTYPYNRYGFVVSKAIDKRATARNSLKRMVRSCVEELRIDKGYDILFVLRVAAKNSTRKDFMIKIRSFLEGLV